jgi:DNA-directed RNA polymerase specialized sigma24 family protein
VLGGGSQPDDTAIARVYGAAMAAAADADAAEEATLRVFAAEGAADRDAETLAATAVRLALRAAPDPEDRDAVALARLLCWPEPRIAAALDIDVPEVRRRLTRGLRAALTAAACV